MIRIVTGVVSVTVVAVPFAGMTIPLSLLLLIPLLVRAMVQVLLPRAVRILVLLLIRAVVVCVRVIMTACVVVPTTAPKSLANPGVLVVILPLPLLR